jgi:ubiquinone/menaquinone biosynthesis C-methylase UbiE
MIERVLGKLKLNEDGIYGSNFTNIDQKKEIDLRKKVAAAQYDDYLSEISKSHSVRVMDTEVKRALNGLKENAIILDLGGCWGWHWRNISNDRPDVKVVIVDFVLENLLHAKEILQDVINNQIWLVHGDATKLMLPDETFDLVWTVQTFQHIPNFESAVKQSFRVLNGGGMFINYSLNRAYLIELIYKLVGRKYHVDGETEDFWFSRASKKQKNIINMVFSAKVKSRYTEILFHPELHCACSGSKNSVIGTIDAKLGASNIFYSLIARQESFHVVKL